MNSREVVYFDRPGPANTGGVIQTVCRRADELGIDRVVAASNSGATALAFQEALGTSATVICVTEHAGWGGGDAISLSEETRARLETAGAIVLTCSHALSGVERSISNSFGGVSRVEMIAHALRMLGEGMKVVVEIAVMAADAGLIHTDREVICVGGTGRGADTAVILRAAHMNNVFDLEIREILAKPRQRRLK